MQLTNSEIRRTARHALEGLWGKAVLATLIVYAISAVTGAFSYASFVVSILLLPLSWGYCVFCLRICRKEEVFVESLFDGFKRYGHILWVMFLKSLYLWLWTLLLIVPGIIKACSYAMTEFIVHDNPDMDADDAIHQSRVMMDGHKMKIFLLYLSFIGWFLLSLLTCGLGFLLLTPYVSTSLAAFYEDLKASMDKKINENLQQTCEEEVCEENGDEVKPEEPLDLPEPEEKPEI